MSPGDSAPVATWYVRGWKRWKLRRSTSVTSTGARRSFETACRPPKPPPTTTTWCSRDPKVDTVPTISDASVPSYGRELAVGLFLEPADLGGRVAATVRPALDAESPSAHHRACTTGVVPMSTERKRDG